MEIETVGRSWWRIKPVDGHDDLCPFGEEHEWDCSQGNPNWKDEHITDWNTRTESDQIAQLEKDKTELWNMLKQIRATQVLQGDPSNIDELLERMK